MGSVRDGRSGSPSAPSFSKASMTEILEEAAHDEGTEASPRIPKVDALSHHGHGDTGSPSIPEDEVLDLEEENGNDEADGDDGNRPMTGDAGEESSSGGATGGATAPSSGAVPPPHLPPHIRQHASAGGSIIGGGVGGSAHSSSSLGGSGRSNGGSSGSASKYSPLPWSNYFQESFDVALPNGDVFHMYKAGTSGPVVLCLHGGGYSGLSFAVAAAQITAQQSKGALAAPSSPSSGAGALTILAMDLRGHGQSRTADDTDLSSETLCDDVIRVVNHLYPSDPPPIVLVGHSMGGAIAIRVAAMHKIPSLSGLVVIDVVEGTAMASLVHMQAILAGRPTRFPSLEKAVEWTLRNGHVRNVESARVSVPSTLVYDESQRQYVWRAALESSEKFWKGWYTGLSEVFLQSPVPKVLLLAGTDRLDKPLTIAQMQGKFQMLVVRHSGHAIQEDEPGEFSLALLHFISRNRISDRPGMMLASWGGPIHP